MKAAPLLNAIYAMREAERLTFTSEPVHFGRTMSQLTSARNALSAELGKVGIYIEPPPACFEPVQTCAEYYHVATADEIAAGKPDLTVAKP